MLKNDDYTSKNVYDYFSRQDNYKLSNSSRKSNTNITQKIKFTGKLEKDDGRAMSFIAEK